MTVLSIPTLSLGFLIAATEPAHASPYITICNYSSSDDDIIAYNDSVFKEYRIDQGACKSVDNAGGNARVDVDPAGGENDIDSYKKKAAGQYWDACVQSENGASNPYNGTTTTYWTSKGLHCE